MFFQMNQNGILPGLLTTSTVWKKEQNKARKPLRVVLFQQVCQTVLDRMLVIANLSSTSTEWENAPGHHSGRKMALSPVEQREQESSTDLASTHRDGQDAEAFGMLGGSFAGGPQHPAFQESEEHIHRNPPPADLSIPAAPLLEGEHHLGAAESPDAQFRVACDPGQSSTTYPEGEPLGYFLGQVLQAAGDQNVRWPLQQEEIKGVLIALRLINPDNLCYIHATLMAFFWGFVHLRCCNWSDLGGAAKILIALCCRDSLWVDVRELEPWAEWISSWDDGRQHDASEFLKAFLAHVRPPVLTGSWIRKIQTEGTIHVQDRGTAYMPPSLVTSAPAQKKVSLQSMITIISA